MFLGERRKGYCLGGSVESSIGEGGIGGVGIGLALFWA
jgi:hypothetical protein